MQGNILQFFSVILSSTHSKYAPDAHKNMQNDPPPPQVRIHEYFTKNPLKILLSRMRSRIFWITMLAGQTRSIFCWLSTIFTKTCSRIPCPYRKLSRWSAYEPTVSTNDSQAKLRETGTHDERREST